MFGDVVFVSTKRIVINKSLNLRGTVKVAGAKNSTLAILAAIVCVGEPCIIENVPDISDVSLMCGILSKLGVEISMIGRNSIKVDPRNINLTRANFDEMRHMRASYYLLSALLSRFGEASVAMPGGCDFGLRPMDQHIKGFEALGAKCETVGGVTSVKCKHLKGGRVYLDVISVGATINTMIAAVRAEGTTIIENAAKEPHVVDLANFLNTCGADIHGAGIDVITISGVKSLKGATYQIIPDQIEAGTYMAASVAARGDILITNVKPKHLESISAKLREVGGEIEYFEDSVRVSCSQKKLRRCNVKTMPYPGFPTDMQPQMVALLSICDGTSMVTEGVWESRFRYISELRRMGAKVSVDGRMAVIEGVHELVGTNVKSVDLRAGAAVVIAGLIAEGTTCVENINHIERGYEDIVGKLSNLGADIKTVAESPQEKVLTA